MENKKHILFISSWYPNRLNPAHGIFNRSFAEAAALHNKVSVLHVCSDESLTKEYELVWQTEPGITTLIIYYKKVKTKLPGISHLKKRSRFIHAFEMGYKELVEKNGAFDLMQLNVILPAGIGVHHLYKKYNIPYVINEGWTGYSPEDGNYKGIIQKLFTRRIAADAKVIMPVSEHLKKAMQSHGIKGNYIIVPNVVDINLFVPKPSQQSEITTFIHISALEDAQKNVSGIIRAFSQVHKKNSKTKLIIIGEGTDKKMLQQHVKELDLTKEIIFKGRLKAEQIVEEINASDVLVMFSNYESFSLVIAEAFACGKPVITSKAGGLTDLVTKELGISIEKENEGQLTEAMLSFAENKIAYNSAYIRKFVTDRYSKEAIGDQLNEVYKKVLDKI